MSQTGKIDCPICGRSFDAFVVTEHVNRCLSQCETKDESKMLDKRSCSPSTGPGKAKGMQMGSLVSEKVTFSAKDQKAPKTQQSPQSNFFTSAKTPKRAFSNVAGKSPTLPPIKKMKSTEQKNHTNVDPGFTPVGGISKKHSDFKPQQPENNEPRSGYPDENSKSGPSIRLKGKEFMPLAERMRPCSFDEYVGQSKVLGSDSLLRSLLLADEIPSMILWGPPGCGKTSLAHIIASKAKASSKSRFVQLSATTSGISDVKEVVRVAKNDQCMFKRKTILFVDEIHRFNKTQQDTFLPHVENGTIILIGATTENPSFQLNTALLSRCRVIVLEKLSSQDIKLILTRALDGMGAVIVDENSSLLRNGDPSHSECSVQLLMVEEEAVEALANLCDGDARVALNGLQLAVQSQLAMEAQKRKVSKSTISNKGVLTNGESQSHENVGGRTIVKVDHIKKGLQRTHLLYDKKGEEHYNSISALHKSIRGSDANAALYWLARMLEGGEDPLYVARRLVRCASEDIGLADPHALNQAVAAYQACHFIGMPECDVILAQAAVYLARAPKSIEVYSAYCEAKKCVKEWKGPQPPIPLHVRNAPTTLMKNLGYGKDYKYNPAYDEPVDQTYLPPEVEGIDFFAS